MKRIIAIIIMFALLISLMACSLGNKNIESLEDVEKQECIDLSISILDDFLKNDFSSFMELASDQIKKELDEEDLQMVFNNLEEYGNIKEYGKTDAVRYYDENLDETYIISQIEVIFEKESLIFTLSYDEEGKLAGFYMK